MPRQRSAEGVRESRTTRRSRTRCCRSKRPNRNGWLEVCLGEAGTLGFLGEDSGGPCVASFRKGPAADLSAREVLRLFQFNVEAQLASGEFSFRAQDPKDKSFWDSFEGAQFDDEGTQAAREIRALLTSADVTGLAIMIPADRIAFGGSAFLVARLKDASLVAVRGSIGGMTL